MLSIAESARVDERAGERGGRVCARRRRSGARSKWTTYLRVVRHDDRVGLRIELANRRCEEEDAATLKCSGVRQIPVGRMGVGWRRARPCKISSGLWRRGAQKTPIGILGASRFWLSALARLGLEMVDVAWERCIWDATGLTTRPLILHNEVTCGWSVYPVTQVPQARALPEDITLPPLESRLTSRHRSPLDWACRRQGPPRPLTSALIPRLRRSRRRQSLATVPPSDMSKSLPLMWLIR